MSNPTLSTVKACVFDAYGTLFDTAAAARHLHQDLGDDWEKLSNLWRTKQLEYTWLRSLMGVYADFRQVTADSLDYALDTLGHRGASLRTRLLALYDRLDAYPEVPAVLDALRKTGRKTAILSNGTPAMLAAAVGNAQLEDRLDDVLSVDALRLYKPHPDAYALATGRFELSPRDIAFFSSNAWDVAGAAQFGFRVVWVNRFGQRPERLPSAPEAVIHGLDKVPALLGG